MKKALIILATILATNIQIFADNNTQIAQALLDSANNAYAKKQYDIAAQFYKKILELGYEAPEVYYNLGNAYFKQNKITDAIYYYEKALKLAPDDKDIKYNLEFANRYITDKIKPVPEFFLTKAIHKTADMFSSNEWAVVSLVAFGMAVLLILVFLFTKSISVKKVAFYSGLLGILISASSLYFSKLQYNRYERSNKAIVFAPTVTLKSSPDKDGFDLMIIHEGLKVEVTDSLNNWYEIKLPDGNKGWTEKQNVRII